MKFLAFWLFPTWYARREFRRAIWTAYLNTLARQSATGKPMRFSAAEFDAWCWLWSERQRLEAELDRFAALLDGMNKRNAQLKADLARATQQKETT